MTAAGRHHGHRRHRVRPGRPPRARWPPRAASTVEIDGRRHPRLRRRPRPHPRRRHLRAPSSATASTPRLRQSATSRRRRRPRDAPLRPPDVGRPAHRRPRSQGPGAPRRASAAQGVRAAAVIGRVVRKVAREDPPRKTALRRLSAAMPDLKRPRHRRHGRAHRPRQERPRQGPDRHRPRHPARGKRARGMTIELGFVFLDDPAYEKQIVFIDVPGHEKFVKTMVAGREPTSTPPCSSSPPTRASPSRRASTSTSSSSSASSSASSP